MRVLTKTTILCSRTINTRGTDTSRVGFPIKFVEMKGSVDAIVAKIDTLSKNEGSGEFWSYDGTTIPW